jgi:LPS export ABC transporter permease LptG
MRILDAYLLRTFALPWLSCLLGFTFLFVIVDLVENLNDFVDAGIPLLGVVQYYVRFLPSIWMYVGPITLLLGLLYALYHLTRNNEVIAMRASGISLYRVLLPFIVLGALISLFSMHISRTVAPRNLGWTQEYMRRMKQPDADVITQLRYRDPESRRTWDIQHLNLDTFEIRGVTLIQERPGGESLEYVLKAESAVWIDPYWFFHQVDFQRFNENGLKAGGIEEFDVMPRQDVTESPERIVRETMNFDFMTSRDMRAYLAERPSISDRAEANLRTQLHMRNAHPWLCLVTMLMAAPFGTQTARKGVFTGVVMCLVLFFGLYFMMNLFKALGLGMSVPPWVAGWTPTLVFGLIGGYLVRRLR